MRRCGIAVVSALIASALFFMGTISTAGARGRAPTSGTEPRLLVLSLPRLTWQDLHDRVSEMPNLAGLLERSAVAALTTRAVRPVSRTADSYVTLSTGTRAVASTNLAGQGLGVDEQFGDERAGDVFARRTGIRVDEGIVIPGIIDIQEKNRKLLYDAEPGSLGDAIADAKVRRSVIANADSPGDSVRPETAASIERHAAMMFMSSRGTIPHGRVDSDLLMSDATAPYGVRLDTDEVMSAFRSEWLPGSAVMIEGSDLERIDGYRSLASSAQRERLQRKAMRDTDELIGRILKLVDPRDTVLTIGPTAPRRANRALTIAAVRSPGVEPGFMRSSTTRRTGFVNIVDIAPTILERLGIEIPDKMEGRPFEIVGDGAVRDTNAAFSDRVDRLAEASRQGEFRDGVVGDAVVVFIVLGIILAIAGVVLLSGGRCRALLGWAALGILGALLGTSFAALFDFTDGGKVAYWLFVLGVGVVFAAVCSMFGRRDPRDPLLLALGATAAVHVVDALTGANLEFNAAFGYSPTVGIRYAGVGNMTFSVTSAALVVCSGLLAARWGRRGLVVALCSLAVTFVVLASPLWGQDFGSALALAPSFALLAWLLLGHQLRWPQAVFLTALVIVSGLIFGFLDYLRPRDSQTHVGRFFSKVQDQGWSGFSTVIRRKAQMNLDVLGSSLWMVLIPLVIGLCVYFVRKRPERVAHMRVRFASLPSVTVAFSVLAVLGFVLNDSGIAIPGMMLLVFDAAVVYLAARMG